MGGEDDPSYTSVKSALSSGKSVVTANKALLAKHGFELAELAEQNNLSIFYEAAVAGSVPIIRTMRQSLGGDNIKKVLGILNGTCNYILTRMEHEGLAFQDVLTQAQELGYAEADPTFDIDGYDTAHKLSILSRLAFGEKIEKDSISVEGIRTITLEDIEAARELGYRIKLLGIAEITRKRHRHESSPHINSVRLCYIRNRGCHEHGLDRIRLRRHIIIIGSGCGWRSHSLCRHRRHL